MIKISFTLTDVVLNETFTVCSNIFKENYNAQCLDIIVRQWEHVYNYKCRNMTITGHIKGVKSVECLDQVIFQF